MTAAPWSSYLLCLQGVCAKYTWLGVSLPCPGSGVLEFEARAHNDIHVCFHNTLSTEASTGDSRYLENAAPYEMLVGGYQNTKSVIRKYGKNQASVTVKENPFAVVVKSGLFDRYWFSLDKGRISMGRGASYPHNKMCEWKDTEPVEGVVHVGVSTWDSPIQFRNFRTFWPYHHGDPSRTGSCSSNSRADAEPSEAGLKFPEWPIDRRADAASLSWRLNLLALQGRHIFCDASVALGSREGQQEPPVPFHSFMVPDPLQISCAADLPAAYLSARPEQSIRSDFKIRCEGEIFETHRALLSSHSPVFFQMLNSGFRESAVGYCDVTGFMSRPAVTALVEFLYLRLPAERVDPPPAELLPLNSLHGIFDACIEFALPWFLEFVESEYASRIAAAKASPAVTSDFLLRLLLAAEDRWNCRNLAAACYRKLAAAFMPSCLFEDALMSLRADQVLALLHYDGDVLDSLRFLTVVDAVVQWLERRIENDPATEAEAVSELELKILPELRFERMSAAELLTLQTGGRYRRLLSLPKSRAAIEDASRRLQSLPIQVLPELAPPVASSASSVDGQLLPVPLSNDNVVPLQFASRGDENGVVFYIGSSAGKRHWANPHASGLVKVSSSSPKNKFSKGDWVICRSSHSTVFFSPNRFGDMKEPWVSLDLSDRFRLCCTHYFFRHDSSASNFIRSWDLQGSTDAEKWIVLSSVRNNMGISFPGACLDKTVDSGGQFYRHFRVVMTGPNSSQSDQLVICGLELYGLLCCCIPFAAPFSAPQ